MQNSIGIGFQAGFSLQSINSIAIGTQAGQFNQFTGAVAIGTQAGQSNQGNQAIAIGNLAGSISQSNGGVSIGNLAGETQQGVNAVSVGYSAGSNYQGNSAVSVGYFAGTNTQGVNAVAIGNLAGYNSQGTGAIAIGYQAGYTSQVAGSIAINASGTQLNPTNTGTYINPIRTSTTDAGLLTLQNQTSKELMCSSYFSYVPGLSAFINQQGLTVQGTTSLTGILQGATGQITITGSYTAMYTAASATGVYWCNIYSTSATSDGTYSSALVFGPSIQSGASVGLSSNNIGYHWVYPLLYIYSSNSNTYTVNYSVIRLF
jgi:hypothetical protein